jgi:hypothetical protein
MKESKLETLKLFLNENKISYNSILEETIESITTVKILVNFEETKKRFNEIYDFCSSQNNFIQVIFANHLDKEGIAIIHWVTKL